MHNILVELESRRGDFWSLGTVLSSDLPLRQDFLLRYRNYVKLSLIEALKCSVMHMILLSFSVENHKSIREQIVLEFFKPTLKTLNPKAGSTWVDHVYGFAGIFGPNASGKSAILDALLYTFSAIRDSATFWLSRKEMTREPFLLDDDSRQRSSKYEIEFVLEDIRYQYGFEVDDEGIVQEWLRDVPSSRWRTLLMRDRQESQLKLHPSIPSLGSVAAKELVLSRAKLLGHPVLGRIGDQITDSFDTMSVKDIHRERRLASITDSLVNGSITFNDIVTLLQVADIGIEQVDVHEDALSPDMKNFFKKVKALLDEQQIVGTNGDASETTDGEKTGTRRKAAVDEDESDDVVRNLMFIHEGSGSERPSFPIDDESDGTVAWLALMVPALDILRRGGIYSVDEIDSSLHPHLVEVLLAIFADPDLNRFGAQLFFTTHDPYILSPLSEVEFEPEQIWFTEKNLEGVTELACLADFPRHKNANVARRYLTGRYGGTPRLAPSAIARLLKAEEAAESVS